MQLLQGLIVFSGLFSCAVAASVPSHHPQNLRTLLTSPKNKWSKSTVISFPNSANFENATERFSAFAPPTYVAAVSPGTEADVATAVKLAARNKIPFLATGGRHGYTTTLGELDEGLAIDLSQLDKVVVDKRAGTLTVGPGVIFRDIYDPVYNAGYEMPTGTCSCVGMIGATIGGGIGRLQGLDGLVLDRLISARIVTADGKIKTISEKSNSDLFWGVRGAGANFGVITSATYSLPKLHNKGVWTMAEFFLPAHTNVTYLNWLATVNIEPRLSVETIMSYNSTLQTPQLGVSIVFAGNEAELRSIIKPVTALESTYENIKEITWNKMWSETNFGFDPSFWCAREQLFTVYTVNLRTHSGPTFIGVYEKIVAFWEENPASRVSQVTFETWADAAVLARPEKSTAYPWRDTQTYIMIQLGWDTNSTTSAIDNTLAFGREIRDDFDATSGYDELKVYINYAFGDESLETRYGAKQLPRLAKLKAKYDPSNVFAYNNALPTSYP